MSEPAEHFFRVFGHKRMMQRRHDVHDDHQSRAAYECGNVQYAERTVGMLKGAVGKNGGRRNG